jgi:alkylation response protein AidB-like acyl-CoA dehydrogenase
VEEHLKRKEENMDYKLAPVNEMIVKAAKDFCDQEIEPIADQIAENNDYPPDLLEKFAKARMLGLVIPKEYGGVGSSNLNIRIWRRRFEQSEHHPDCRRTWENGHGLRLAHAHEQQYSRDHIPLGFRRCEKDVSASAL